jgi:hypothetical protein
MLITMIDVYGGKELLVNDSKNRIVVSEKNGMQKRFEKWLSQTRSQRSSRTIPTKDLQMKAE